MVILSVIIVTYNSEHEIKPCLDSVLSQVPEETEIIVVDNGSTDATVRILARYADRLETVACAENQGYARGNNRGFEKATGKYLFLLNPDTVVCAGAVASMIAHLESREKAAMIAPLMLNVDGSPQASVRRFPDYGILLFELLGLSRLFPRSKVFNRWRIPEFDFSSLQEIEQPMAAALMIRKAFVDSMLLDERFVMFFNDVDLCRRIRDKGGTIVFFPDATIIHSRGASTARVRERMIPFHIRGFMDYLRKYRRSPMDGVLLWMFTPALVLNAMLRIFSLRILGISF